MSIIKKLYDFILTIQIVLLFIFIVINYANLDAVDFSINLDGAIYEFTLNMYIVVGIIGVLFLIIILSSISIFGAGLNDTGSQNIGKYLSLSALLGFFTLISSYFILPFGYFGVMAQLFCIIIYVLYAIETLNGNSGGME